MKKIAVILFLLPLLAAGRASGLGLNPAVTELLVSPGMTHRRSITVTNPSETAVQLEVQLENWLKRRGVETETASIEPREWITFPAQTHLGPGESRTIEYDIHIPHGLKGQLVAMAFFTPVTRQEGLSLRSRFGASIYAAIKGTEEIACEITNIYATDNGFRVSFRNKGNVHLRPDGYVMVTGRSGSAVKVPLQAGTPVFPGKDHSYIAVLGEALPGGFYVAQAVIEYGMMYGEKRTIKSEAVSFTR